MRKRRISGDELGKSEVGSQHLTAASAIFCAPSEWSTSIMLIPALGLREVVSQALELVKVPNPQILGAHIAYTQCLQGGCSVQNAGVQKPLSCTKLK